MTTHKFQSSQQDTLEDFVTGPEVTSRGRKFIIGIFDGFIIVLAIGWLIYFQRELFATLTNKINFWLFLFLFVILYRLLTHILFGATIGMLIMKSRLRDHLGNPPSFLQKVLSAVMVMFNGANYFNVK